MKYSPRVRAEDFQAMARLRNHPTMPGRMHRKLWEHVMIEYVYLEYVGQGGKAVGFGVGAEKMPAWLQANGAEVVATDIGADAAVARQWVAGGQHLSNARQVAGVTCRSVDMRKIPGDLLDGTADFVWSASSMEHLGSLGAGAKFFCESMGCLRPGGVAVHTTEFNPTNGKDTLCAGTTVLYRESDLEELVAMAAQQGDHVLPLDLAPGTTPEDAAVLDPPHKGDVHLTIHLGRWITTSIALIAIRGGAA